MQRVLAFLWAPHTEDVLLEALLEADNNTTCVLFTLLHRPPTSSHLRWYATYQTKNIKVLNMRVLFLKSFNQIHHTY